MGLLQRIWQVVRANFSDLVDRAEDPEKVIEQTVLEMQQSLIEMRQAVAQAIATQKRTERQLAQNKSTAGQWRERAQMALAKGNETLAKEALVRGQSYKSNAETLQAHLDQQKGVIDRLKKELRTLESKIAETKTKKDMYIARARSATASQKIRELADSANNNSSLTAFERMEDKVMELEAYSDATQSLETDNLEQRFAALEAEGSDRAQLPASDSTQIDREIDKLQADIDKL